MTGSNFGSKMLTLPVYLRHGVYYLHTRIAGRQFKRSLDTRDAGIAKLKAFEFLKAIAMNKPKLSDFNFEGITPSKYEIDFSKGVFKATGKEDHDQMMAALVAIKGSANPTSFEPLAVVGDKNQTAGLRLVALLDKFFLLKSNLKQSTVLTYKNTVLEFSRFLKNPLVTTIGVADVTRYQEYLASQKNTIRTIDNKIAVVRAVLNFAKRQGYFFEKNPAEGRNLLSKRQKMTGGWAIFEMSEMEIFFKSAEFLGTKNTDLDYFWVLTLALITGCRVSEITSLDAKQFKISDQGNRYLKVLDAKTSAGIREIPLPNELFLIGFDAFLNGKTQVFKYQNRAGKGSGNAVGKKFSRHLETLKLAKSKLVFHSIRKFLNDYLLKNEVSFEARCQILGHEIDSVNVQTYANKLTIDQLSSNVKLLQISLLKRCGVIP